VGYGQRITINDLASTICRLAGSRSPIQHLAERAGDVKHSLAAVEKLRAAAFQFQGNCNDGLNATVGFFRSK
jgi:UDP-glucose 4-epimerase